MQARRRPPRRPVSRYHRSRRLPALSLFALFDSAHYIWLIAPLISDGLYNATPVVTSKDKNVHMDFPSSAVLVFDVGVSSLSRATRRQRRRPVSRYHRSPRLLALPSMKNFVESKDAFILILQLSGFAPRYSIMSLIEQQ